MDLTVITTIFNCEKYLPEALNSIVHQSRKDFNWIIINDGSTDNSQEIIDKLKVHSSTNLVRINNNQNLRLPVRLNQGIMNSVTKYVALADGDDISLPNRLEEQYSRISGDKLFCIGSLPIIIDENSTVNQDLTDNYRSLIPLTHQEIYSTLFFKNENPIMHPSVMMDRFLLSQLIVKGNKCLPYSELEPRCPDLDLWCRAIQLGFKFLNLNKQLIKYRIHKGNLSGTTGILMEQDRKRILEKYGFLKESHD